MRRFGYPDVVVVVGLPKVSLFSAWHKLLVKVAADAITWYNLTANLTGSETI